MNDSQEQARRAVREMGRELTRVVDQCQRTFRQATDDLSGLVGRTPDPLNLRRNFTASPAERIRQLGQLRDEGLITEAEFLAKKSELLTQL